MKGTSRKTSNLHKAHPTNCERCGRQLPKRHYQAYCASCIKISKSITAALEAERRSA